MVRPLMRPLAPTAVTPNQITWVRLAGGIIAAALLAIGEEHWRTWGAGVFLLSFFLDRADGELARLSGKKSAFGHRLDLISDSLCNGLAFLGLGIGLRDGMFGDWAWLMGGLAGLAVGAILLLVMKLEAAAGARAAELGGSAGFDPDDGMLAVPLFIWLGGSELLLALAALGAPLFALFMILKFRRAGPGRS